MLAGEMSHHDVLDIMHKGTSIIMADYFNTERGFLHRAKVKIEGLCKEGVEVWCSNWLGILS